MRAERARENGSTPNEKAEGTERTEGEAWGARRWFSHDEAAREVVFPKQHEMPKSLVNRNIGGGVGSGLLLGPGGSARSGGQLVTRSR